MPLDPTFKVLWIADLRSGKHEQTLGMLRRDEAFCCLGRATDISGKGTWVEVGYGGFAVHWDNGQSPQPYLPIEFGLSYEDQVILANMNDSGKTFAEIADYIEDNL